MTYPSRKVQLMFDERITNTVANEGEPAALGKTTTGPVYYNDGTTEHKNRVWIRKGANLEVVLLARADDMGVPDVPNLQIRVAERNGIFWVTSYDRNDPAAAPTGGGGTVANNIYSFGAGEFGPGIEGVPMAITNYGNPLYTPIWQMPEDSNNSIGASFISEVTGTTVDVYVYWATYISATGNWAAATTVDARADGERMYQSALNGTSIVAEFLANGATVAHEVQVLHHAHTVDVAVGDLVRVHIERSGANASDTMTDAFGYEVRILGMQVVVNGGDGGSGTSGDSGTHQFGAMAMADATLTNWNGDGWILANNANSLGPLLSFRATKASATLTLKVYWYGQSFSTGNVYFSIDCSGDMAGEEPWDNRKNDNDFVEADGGLNVYVEDTFTIEALNPIAIGDLVTITIGRQGGDASDTLSGDVVINHATVIENGD